MIKTIDHFTYPFNKICVGIALYIVVTLYGDWHTNTYKLHLSFAQTR
jgi:hypothetical protein